MLISIKNAVWTASPWHKEVVYASFVMFVYRMHCNHAESTVHWILIFVNVSHLSSITPVRHVYAYHTEVSRQFVQAPISAKWSIVIIVDDFDYVAIF